MSGLDEVLREAVSEAGNIMDDDAAAKLVRQRLEAYAQILTGRLEIAALIGAAEHAVVTMVPIEVGDWANDVVIRADSMVDLDLRVGETVLVITQRRWDA